MFAKPVLSALSQRLVQGMSALLLITLLAALLPASVSASPLAKPECKSTYEVKRGDTLTKIGTRYGRTASQIVAANEWGKPYTIYVGQRICISTEKKSDLPKLESKYADALAVYFGAARAADDANLLIYTYNYPKTTVVVKVDNASDSKRNFVEVGQIDIAAVGNRQTWRFKLPVDLKSARQIYICLKDLTTDHLQCVYPRSGP